MNQISIQKIFIEKLFGYYTYELKADNNANLTEKLFILYGDNGSGKTTILRLIFFLLSTKHQSGFKSEISKTKFKKFSITFSNNYEIGAERTGDLTIGSFNFYIKKGRTIIKEMMLRAKEADLSIDITKLPSVEEEYNDLLNIISDLGIKVFYLSDERTLLNSLTSTIRGSEEDERIYYMKQYDTDVIRKRNLDRNKYSVEIALENLIVWINDQIIFNSKIGERDTNNIYVDLVNSVVKTRKTSKNIEDRAIEISKLIEDIANRSSEYSNLGLINSFETKNLIEALQSAKNEKLVTVTAILEPFIEGVRARLNALENLKNTIQKFLYHINSFYSKKKIAFSVENGFTIVQESSRETIRPNLLSSGEKQLLLLFANTITATDQATFFIIDEPEISLNIKWQRMLVNSLLDFSKNSPVQFLLATHSFELLSTKPDCVIKLEEIV